MEQSFLNELKRFYENIYKGDSQQQGFDMSNSTYRLPYSDAIKLLKNQDDYDFNLLTLPGLVHSNDDAKIIISEAQQMVESRGDAFLIVDPAKYGTTLEESKEGHVAFLTHLQEELMDAINYIEKLKEFYGVLNQDPPSSNTESI